MEAQWRLAVGLKCAAITGHSEVMVVGFKGKIEQDAVVDVLQKIDFFVILEFVAN